jgi:hypothetical protein
MIASLNRGDGAATPPKSASGEPGARRPCRSVEALLVSPDSAAAHRRDALLLPMEAVA